MLPQKRKATDYSYFDEKWEWHYLCKKVGGFSVCLDCKKQLTLKKYNIKRHYDTFHKENYDHLTVSERAEVIKTLKRDLATTLVLDDAQSEGLPGALENDDSRNTEDVPNAHAIPYLQENAHSSRNHDDEDDMMRSGSSYKQSNSLYDAVQALKDISKHTRVQNEFHMFGQYIAIQLEQFPIEEALQIQLEIQNLVTNKRLNLLKDGRPDSQQSE